MLDIFSGGRVYAKESQAADATLPAPSRRTSTQRSATNTQRQVNVNINGNVMAHDYRDFQRQIGEKAQQAAMGGWG